MARPGWGCVCVRAREVAQAVIGTLTVPLSAVGNTSIMGVDVGGQLAAAAEVITSRQSWKR